MKKNLKKILACTLALSTLCAVSPLSVSANNVVLCQDSEGRTIWGDTFSEFKGYDEDGEPIIEFTTPERISEEYIAIVPYGKYPYIEAMKSENYARPTGDTIGKEIPKEMLHLIDSMHDGYICNTGVENTKVCVMRYLGDDKDGNMIWSNLNFAKLEGFDDENKPIVTYNGELISLAKPMGFVNNKVYLGSIYDRYIYDIDGTPKFAGMSYADNGWDILKTIDITTEEKILVIKEPKLGGEVIAKCGDTNCDGTVDVRDVTSINQHIIKENVLPDYADIVADVNDDGNIDISDLGMLKKYIIKMIDSF